MDSVFKYSALEVKLNSAFHPSAGVSDAFGRLLPPVENVMGAEEQLRSHTIEREDLLRQIEVPDDGREFTASPG